MHPWRNSSPHPRKADSSATGSHPSAEFRVVERAVRVTPPNQDHLVLVPPKTCQPCADLLPPWTVLFRSQHFCTTTKTFLHPKTTSGSMMGTSHFFTFSASGYYGHMRLIVQFISSINTKRTVFRRLSITSLVRYMCLRTAFSSCPRINQFRIHSAWISRTLCELITMRDCSCPLRR